MPRFHTAQDAYEWAVGTHQAWMFGRAFDPDPERFWGGTGGMSDVLDAITIVSIIRKHDIVRAGISMFQLWYMPDPMQIHYWTDVAREKVQAAAHEFEEELKTRGYIIS